MNLVVSNGCKENKPNLLHFLGIVKRTYSTGLRGLLQVPEQMRNYCRILPSSTPVARVYEGARVLNCNSQSTPAPLSTPSPGVDKSEQMGQIDRHLFNSARQIQHPCHLSKVQLDCCTCRTRHRRQNLACRSAAISVNPRLLSKTFQPRHISFLN